MATDNWYEEITHREYKYQLLEMMEFQTEIRPTRKAEFPDVQPFVSLETNGRLCTEAGYAWDGADGCPDVKAVMRASLAHDAVYQLIRKRKLPGRWRAEADRMFRWLCIKDGMSAALAWPVFGIVRGLGWTSAKPDR